MGASDGVRPPTPTDLHKPKRRTLSSPLKTKPTVKRQPGSGGDLPPPTRSPTMRLH